MSFRFYNLLLSFVAIGALAACGSAATPTAAPAPTVAPAPTQIPQATTVPAQNNAASTQDFVPKVRTVWNTVIGTNTMQGACSGAPILPAYGPVQITPESDGSLSWKNQQTTYVFKKSAPNEFRFVGDSPLNDGKVDMLLTFVDTKKLAMEHKFIPVKDAQCTHVFKYNGEFQWERP